MATEQRLIAGRYELGPVLGQGGMAQVHRGRDTRLGRTVAIKLLRADFARDPAFQGRFRREAQSVAALNHPAIVAVYDTGADAGPEGLSPYIVMEYVEGRTLRQVLDAEGRLLPQRALEITAQVCGALEAAHRAGIVHRDIKPANVMLTPDGDVRVMDFGIARAVTGSSAALTQTAAVIGTANYLSPEQARGEHVDARSDVYSTGCLLYELLTGGPPFTGDNPVAVAYQHVREAAVPPSRVETDVPAAVDAIVLKAMAKNPANRYQSAAELRDDIERALAGRPVEATPVLAEDSTTLLPPPATTVLLRQPVRRGGRVGAYLLLALATAAVFVVALLVARGLLSGGSSEVNTPNVIGQTLPDAEAILTAKGLTVGPITRAYDPTGKFPAGYVMNQDPRPDLLLGKGGSVALVVSRGIHMVPVPTALVGLDQTQAEVALKAVGLKLGEVVPRSSAAPAGQVLGTDPPGGTRVPIGSKVTLFVSNAQVKVPNVVGKDLATAEALLEQRGFTVLARPAPVYDRRQPLNVVVSQSPAAATFAPIGPSTPVTVYYNAKPSPSPSPTPSASASASGSASPSASATP